MKHIIGSGLIAKSFTNLVFNEKTLVLASGVANSQETRTSEFERERALIHKEITCHPGFRIIYCSTCSIDSGITSPYISHKLNMEETVRELATSFYIWRLPQMVGPVKNFTLVSFFVRAILNDQVLNVQAGATRNLLDVSDFARIVSVLANRHSGINTVQNVASASSVSVLEIVNEISRLLERIPKIVLSPAGYSHDINIDFLRKILPANDPIIEPDYWKQVLRRNVPMYAQMDTHSLETVK